MSKELSWKRVVFTFHIRGSEMVAIRVIKVIKVDTWKDAISHQTPLVDTEFTTTGFGNLPSTWS